MKTGEGGAAHLLGISHDELAPTDNPADLRAVEAPYPTAWIVHYTKPEQSCEPQLKKTDAKVAGAIGLH